jgi:hypothetical protein
LDWLIATQIGERKKGSNQALPVHTADEWYKKSKRIAYGESNVNREKHELEAKHRKHSGGTHSKG